MLYLCEWPVTYIVPSQLISSDGFLLFGIVRVAMATASTCPRGGRLTGHNTSSLTPQIVAKGNHICVTLEYSNQKRETN